MLRPSTSAESEMLPVGARFPDGVLRSDDRGDGEQVLGVSDLLRASDLTIVAVFSTGCQSCFGFLRSWEDVRSELPADVEIVGVAAASDSDFLRYYVEEAGVSYRVFSASRALLGRWRVAAYPSAYMIDRDGHVVGRVAGEDAALRMLELLSASG